MIVQDVIDAATILLNDPDMVVWQKNEYLTAVDQAVAAVVSVRPDAYVITATFKLEAGSEQRLPVNGQRLIQAYCNFGIDAAAAQAPGSAIRLTDKNTLDEADMGWHSAPAGSEVYEAAADPKVPEVFFVNPPAPADLWIKASYTASPGSLNGIDDTIPLPAKYLSSLVEWVLYLLFGRDGVETPNYARSMAHQSAFFNLIGAKAQADASIKGTV